VPQPFPALAIRAAVVATTTAAALLSAVSAPTPAPAPAPAAPQAPTATLPGPGTTAVLAAPFAPPAPPAAPVLPAPAVAPVPEVQTPVVPVASRSSSSASAMRRALSKVGSPYRWGAAGPNAFDCSGLVSWAYRNSGVSLPRSSRAMSRVGTPVSRNQLQPGDLVFFYRPVSHVGIYIGGGKIVHASSRKYPVKISDMGRMKFNSARRV
jgi:peptidoglycan DL-endopeptidase CwlO